MCFKKVLYAQNAGHYVTSHFMLRNIQVFWLPTCWDELDCKTKKDIVRHIVVNLWGFYFSPLMFFCWEVMMKIYLNTKQNTDFSNMPKCNFLHMVTYLKKRVNHPKSYISGTEIWFIVYFNQKYWFLVSVPYI